MEKFGIGSALVLAGILLAASVLADDFVKEAWLCATPEAYQQALEAQAGLEGPELGALRERLLAEKSCTYLRRDEFGKIITAVRIMEKRGDLVRVMFGMQVGDQMPGAERREAFYRMSAWTGRDNLAEKP